MAIQTIFDTGSDYQIQPALDGGVYDIAVGGDCVCGGIGDEFAIHGQSETSNIITFNAGSQAIIGGSFFKVTTNTNVTLNLGQTNYVVAEISSTGSPGSHGSFSCVTTSTDIHSDNLNGVGGTRDLLLYTITCDSSGVTNVVDNRNIRTSAGQTVGTYGIWVGFQNQYDAITTKSNSMLYFIKESQ